MTPEYTRATKAVDLLTDIHMTGRNPHAYGKKRAEDYRLSRGWGWRSEILGIGVAPKAVAGKPSGPVGLTVFVRRKLAKSRLLARRFIPPELRLRAIGVTVPTDVVELRGTLIGHAPADRIRPLQAGIEVTHEFGDFGSLCAIVRWNQRPDKLFGLGCSHTIARCGIDVTPDVDLIEQPRAVADLEMNAVGKLSPCFSTIAFNGNPNTADFALFEIDDSTGSPTNRILDQNRSIASVDTRTAQDISTEVETELFGIQTEGAVGVTRAFRSSWRVNLRRPNLTIGIAVFTNVVAYTTDCSEGDSGGAVLERGTSKLLGMHFAGIQVSRFGLFIPAGPLFEENGLSLV